MNTDWFDSQDGSSCFAYIAFMPKGGVNQGELDILRAFDLN